METKILNDFIAEIRKHSVYGLARKSGVSVTAIESWIYEKSVPSLINAARVADAMGLEFLLFDKEE